jgi:elongation factor P
VREIFAVAAIMYTQVRKGMVLVSDDGQLYFVVDRELNTPGNWRAILQIKLKNLKTGSVAVRRVHPEDKVEQAFLDKRDMQYIYQDGDGYVFMDTETFDQTTLSRDWVGEQMLYLKEGFKAAVTFHEGAPLSLELPAQVHLAVADTIPGVRGGTAATASKPATLETGLKMHVPNHVENGDVIAIDTRTGQFITRVSR